MDLREFLREAVSIRTSTSEGLHSLHFVHGVWARGR